MPTGTGGRDGASLQVRSGIDHNDAAFLQDVSRVNENCLGRQDKLTAAKKTSTRNCVRAPTRLLSHSMQLTERVRNNAGRDAANRPEPRHHSLMVRRRNHQWCGVLALHPRLNPHNPQVTALPSGMGKGISAPIYRYI